MYKVSKNLSEQLKLIDSKTKKVDFTIEYLFKLIDKKNIKVLEDGELNELMCIVDSSMKLCNKTQASKLNVIYDSLIAEEARRLDASLKKGFVYKLKNKLLKFLKSFK